MKVLFVHRNFPGQFLHLVRHLAAERTHDLVAIGEAGAGRIDGVRTLFYDPPACSADTHRDAREFDVAMRRASSVACLAGRLAALGFTPDAVIGHDGWGELLNLPDVWPDVPVIAYREFFYSLGGADVGFDREFPMSPSEFSRVRAKNAVGLLGLHNGGRGVAPTAWQRSTFPAWAQPGIAVLPEGVDLDACRPDPAARRRKLVLGGIGVAPGHTLLTFVARDLEPYRGFHVMMRALPRLLAARPELHAVLVGGDDVSYGARLESGSWRARMLDELGTRLDPSRVHFPGRLGYRDYVRLLQRSDAHVYLTYPFVLSWSLREALACGCAVVASDTPPVAELVRDGENGLLTPCLDPVRLADRVLELLVNPGLAARLRRGARATAEAHLRLDDQMRGYRALLREATGWFSRPGAG